MEIKQLKTFLVSSETLNFSKAGEQLNFAQSSISDQIKSLEAEMDCKLFERLGRKLALTKEGEILKSYASKIVRLSDEAKNIMLNKHVPAGDLRIVIAETLCVFRLPNLFSDYYELYPDVNLKLSLRNCTDFPDILRRNIADIAFTLDDKRVYHDLISIDILEEEIVLIASKNDLLAEKKHIELKDLNRRNLILTQKGCSYRNNFERHLYESQVNPKSIMEMETLEGIKRYVKNGFGISFLPKIACLEELESGEFIQLTFDGPRFYTTAQILYHKDKWITPTIKELIDMTTNEFADQ